MINTLLQLREIQKIIKEQQIIMKRLLMPQVNDYSFIPRYYKLFCTLFADIPYKSVYHRGKFIYVILYLYSPGALIGGRTRIGLREALAKVFNINDKQIISKNIGDLRFYFDNYKDFRDDVELFYKKVKID
ncbi:MAG: hypothetical protein RR312_08735 [Bacteroidales bacterium]